MWNVGAWTPDADYHSENERYLAVYEHLTAGVYGDCYGINAEYDEEDNVTQEATEFELTVEQFESKDEDGQVFFFEKIDQPSGMRKFIEDYGQHGNWQPVAPVILYFFSVAFARTIVTDFPKNDPIDSQMPVYRANLTLMGRQYPSRWSVTTP